MSMGMGTMSMPTTQNNATAMTMVMDTHTTRHIRQRAI
jgi:hypothetical protein